MLKSTDIQHCAFLYLSVDLFRIVGYTKYAYSKPKKAHLSLNVLSFFVFYIAFYKFMFYNC